jgi:hypothetical protein
MNPNQPPEILIDVTDFGLSLYVTPEIANSMAKELDWSTEGLDRLRLNQDGTAYWNADGEAIHVKPHDTFGWFIAI